MNSIEQEALKITRGKLSYKLLNLHIIFRRLFYGFQHEKTTELVRKRSLIDYSTIQRVREAQRIANSKVTK